MNYKDLIGITTENNRAIAYIPDVIKLSNIMYMRDDYRSLYIYNFISEEQAVCGYRNGTRDIYKIKTIDNDNWICLENDGKEEKIANLKDLVLMFALVGEIDSDNKIYSEYFNQGFIYKNEIAYLKTKGLSKEELEKIPLRDKVCYIPEGAFDNKDYIDLNLKDLKDGKDYYTVEAIRDDIRNYFGEDTMKKISKKELENMVEDVFYMVDWQYPSSLLDADEYLDDYVDEILDSKSNKEGKITGEDYGF